MEFPRSNTVCPNGPSNLFWNLEQEVEFEDTKRVIRGNYGLKIFLNSCLPGESSCYDPTLPPPLSISLIFMMNSPLFIQELCVIESIPELQMFCTYSSPHSKMIF